MGSSVEAIQADYKQSANTLFHFMEKEQYLEDALKRRALVPRYCTENIEYLNLELNGNKYPQVLILQKCFCDIPFHKLMETFELDISSEQSLSITDGEKHALAQKCTHPDCYGKYAIAFSKSWAESRNLQPIHYINERSDLSKRFSSLFSELGSMDDLPDSVSDDILQRLSFMKPLRGIMPRTFQLDKDESKSVDICKNFHDEKEWRFIPCVADLSALNLQAVIANPSITNLRNIKNLINGQLETEKYRKLWLDFDYDDIRYIIVPTSTERAGLIKFIIDLHQNDPKTSEANMMDDLVLISKILVLEEIGKDS